MDGCPQFLFFSYIIYFVMEILWRPLVAGERIGRWMDGKSGKIGLKKNTILLSVVISCYQKLLSVVIM